MLGGCVLSYSCCDELSESNEELKQSQVSTDLELLFEQGSWSYVDLIVNDLTVLECCVIQCVVQLLS